MFVGQYSQERGTRVAEGKEILIKEHDMKNYSMAGNYKLSTGNYEKVSLNERLTSILVIFALFFFVRKLGISQI